MIFDPNQGSIGPLNGTRSDVRTRIGYLLLVGFGRPIPPNETGKIGSRQEHNAGSSDKTKRVKTGQSRRQTKSEATFHLRVCSA